MKRDSNLSFVAILARAVSWKIDLITNNQILSQIYIKFE